MWLTAVYAEKHEMQVLQRRHLVITLSVQCNRTRKINKLGEEKNPTANLRVFA